MIIVNKPGDILASSDKILAKVEGETLSIISEHTNLAFRKGESMNPRILVMSVQGERIVNLQFVPVADNMKSIFMPDYETAEKFLTFVEHFINN